MVGSFQSVGQPPINLKLDQWSMSRNIAESSKLCQMHLYTKMVIFKSKSYKFNVVVQHFVACITNTQEGLSITALQQGNKHTNTYDKSKLN